MTNDERASLEVLRAEMNGKLDLLLERLGNLMLQVNRHETRLGSLEERGSRNAQEAVNELAKLEVRMRDAEAYLSGEKMTEYSKSLIGRFEYIESTVRGIGVKIATASGVVGAIIFVVNFGLAKKWF